MGQVPVLSLCFQLISLFGYCGLWFRLQVQCGAFLSFTILVNHHIFWLSWVRTACSPTAWHFGTFRMLKCKTYEGNPAVPQYMVTRVYVIRGIGLVRFCLTSSEVETWSRFTAPQPRSGAHVPPLYRVERNQASYMFDFIYIFDFHLFIFTINQLVFPSRRIL